MKLLKIALLFLFFSSSNLSAQQGVFEDFDYVVIPIQFSFQTMENENQINSLLRYLFKEDGFNVFMDTEEIPAELKPNPCKGIRLNLEKEFTPNHTFVTIILYDCEGKIVLASRGKTELQTLRAAYHDAIRDAFENIAEANKPVSKINTSNNEPALSEEEKQKIKLTKIKEESTAYLALNQLVYFYPNKDGFDLYKENSTESFAELSPINEEMFIYNSDEINGVMTKKENGNFELEYRELTSKETKILEYILQQP